MLEEKTLSNGKKLVYLVKGYKIGLKYFLSEGYTICHNKNYVKKDDIYFHYNKIMNAWIKEE